MKITESKLKQVIAEEYKKVVLINEMKQSSDYQRLVEIVGRERADLVVEGFFDKLEKINLPADLAGFIPGSSENKLKAILKDLEGVDGSDNQAIDAVFAKHGVGAAAADKAKPKGTTVRPPVSLPPTGGGEGGKGGGSGEGTDDDDETEGGEDDGPGEGTDDDDETEGGEDDGPGEGTDDDDETEDGSALEKFEQHLQTIENIADVSSLSPGPPGYVASLTALIVNLLQMGVHAAGPDKGKLKGDLFDATVNLIGCLPIIHEAAMTGKAGKTAALIAKSEKSAKFMTKVLPKLQKLRDLAVSRTRVKSLFGDRPETMDRMNATLDSSEKKEIEGLKNLDPETFSQLQKGMGLLQGTEAVMKNKTFDGSIKLLFGILGKKQYAAKYNKLKDNIGEVSKLLDFMKPSKNPSTKEVVESMIKEELQKHIKG
jgi:hypothetical protein